MAGPGFDSRPDFIAGASSDDTLLLLPKEFSREMESGRVSERDAMGW